MMEAPVKHPVALQAVPYTTALFLLLGGATLWLRMKIVLRVTDRLHTAFLHYKAASAAHYSKTSGATRAHAFKAAESLTSAAVFDFRSVYRFKDATQLSVLCRDMRVWDEEGVPDPAAAEYGEFIIKCGLARMPKDPTLLVMYASFLIEVHKNGQAASLQLQLAQKANPSLYEQLHVYMAQQLAKQFQHDNDSLDLLGYVEYQRMYSSCVHAHKVALLAQQQFWNSLLQETLRFADLQKVLLLMKDTMRKAGSFYRRAIDRYPTSGRLLKAYGRFLEFVCNEPQSASRCYAKAAKYGTVESMLDLAKAQKGDHELLLAAAGINEENDGLVIIDAQGQILMVNSAAFTMFGFEKGELEGKNVTVLMPPPFSTHHDSFLKRYINTGVAHIEDMPRSVLALHKDHSLFPVSLLATRLSGIGTDSLFLGVLRHTVTFAVSDKRMRFWTSANGLVMTAETGMAGILGLVANSTVGQTFVSLFADDENVRAFLHEVASNEVGTLSTCQRQAKMLHKYLPPVDVQLSAQVEGALEDYECRFLIVEVCLVHDSEAVMAVNDKGRLVYVTHTLAAMLGYTASAMVKMNLNNLLPQPYCQMHRAWFKNADQHQPGPSSCRSGGVVHILAADGTQVPVTLRMSTTEATDSEGSLHVVYVSKASAVQSRDQKCLLLNINYEGTILSVNTGCPSSLYGFNPSDIVGKPLACVIDAFGLWQLQYGNNSLLALLACEAITVSFGKANQDAAATLLGDGSSQQLGRSWRVGVHRPVDVQDMSGHAAQLVEEATRDMAETARLTGGGILQALQRKNYLKAACMAIQMLEFGSEAMQGLPTADTPVMQVSLYRSDTVTSTIELDTNLDIIHADVGLSLMFGVSHKDCHKKSFARLIDLPCNTTYDDLLGSSNQRARRGAMKASTRAGDASSLFRMGTAKRLSAVHLADGGKISFELQAFSFQQRGRLHLMVHLRLLNPISASYPSLVKLKGTAEGLNAQGSLGHQPSQLTVAGPWDDDEDYEVADYALSDAAQYTEATAKPTVVVTPLSLKRQKSRATSTHANAWMGQRSKNQHMQEGSETSQGDNDESESDAGRSAMYLPRQGSYIDVEGYMERPDTYRNGRWSPHSHSNAAKHPDDLGETASAGDDDSQLPPGSESREFALEVQNDELAVNVRRAKRLKKLRGILQSNVAQVASNRWRKHTLLLMGVIIVVHVAAYAILTKALQDRSKTAQKVADMAAGIETFLSTALRANYIQRCYLPQFANDSLCSTDMIEDYMNELLSSLNRAQHHHHSLYLGSTGLQPFADSRIVEYWTRYKLPELVYVGVEQLDNGTLLHGQVMPGERPLWSMGNLFISYGRDFHFHAKEWKDNINATTEFNYVYLNGINMFTGYAWSLDAFVDYAWRDLTKLSAVLLEVLIVEVLVVQLSCILYEWYLLHKCNLSNICLFSVLLALPTATVRIMAQRQLQVDDTTGVADDQEMELDLGEQAKKTAATEAVTDVEVTRTFAGISQKKSVRLMDTSGQDAAYDQGLPGANDAGRAGARPARSNNARRSKNMVQQQTGLDRWIDVISKKLWSWMHPTFKKNGKKLQGNNRAVWKVMAPLTVWLVALLVVPFVTHSYLRNVHGPLTSLNAATHVLYHVSISRLIANLMAFGVDPGEKMGARFGLKAELAALKQEYSVLLYGGKLLLKANMTSEPVAPVGAFSDKPIADLFFRTTDCLRTLSKDSCITDPSHSYHAITHMGLDALVNRYLDEMVAFSNLPDSLALPSHPSYLFAHEVGGYDLEEGLQASLSLFLQYTMNRFNVVQRLQQALLIGSFLAVLLFLLLLYKPYIKQLQHDRIALIDMLSQLPPEVEVEAHIRSVLLDMKKSEGGWEI